MFSFHFYWYICTSSTSFLISTLSLMLEFLWLWNPVNSSTELKIIGSSIKLSTHPRVFRMWRFTSIRHSILWRGMRKPVYKTSIARQRLVKDHCWATLGKQCLKAGILKFIARQRLMIGHVPAETKTASGRCVKNGIQQKRIWAIPR
jgi:hypothetical protein